MKHILLVTDSYPPEIRSASHLMQELAEELLARGYKVSVATTWPQYNLDTKSNTQQFKELSDENGITVLRIKTLPHHKVNYIIRGIAQITFPRLFIKKIKQYQLDKADAVIVYSPPLPLASIGKYFKKQGLKFILNVQDLFPQNAIDLGILKNPLLIRFFKRMEKNAYKAADNIVTHSEGNTTLLKQQHPRLAEKFSTLHNWVDVSHFQNRKITKDFRQFYNITPDKFVAVFAGVLGPSQNLDFILEAAKSLQQSAPDFLFLLVGDGAEKEKLEKIVKEEKLNNVVFKPFISKDEYPDLLVSCNLGLVSLSPKNKTPVVPGKISGYMAAALPIAALINQESDGHQILQDAQCGYSTPSDNLDNAIALLQKCYEQRETLKQLGQNGLTYVTEHFSKEKIIDQLTLLID